jgi:hypothetical protein
MYKLFNGVEQWELKLAVVLSIIGTLTLIATAMIGLLSMYDYTQIPK